MADAKAPSKSKAVSTVEVKEDNKKNLLVMQCDEYTLYRIGYEGGGEVPAVLKGLYTSRPVAEAAVRAYLEGK